MKILVTGSNGYIGSTLVEMLLKDNHKVIAYDNLMYKQTSLLNQCHNTNFQFVYGDVRDHETLGRYANQADVIIPLAAIVGAPACDRDVQLAEDVNYKHVKFLADNLGKRMLLYPNSNSGYGASKDGMPLDENSPLNPISHYGRTKCDAEKSVLQVGGIAFRLATVFGTSARQRIDLLVNDFTYKALTDGYIVLFEKHFKRNYIHVRDVCSAFMLLMNKYDERIASVFNVGLSSANLSKHELALKIKEHIPNFSIQSDEIREDKDKRDYVIDNSRIERMGWKPQFSLDDGIRELIKGFKILFQAQQVFTNL
jgi:nucleoside-diphosphate-sugar epimerase